MQTFGSILIALAVLSGVGVAFYWLWSKGKLGRLGTHLPPPTPPHDDTPK